MAALWDLVETYYALRNENFPLNRSVPTALGDVMMDDVLKLDTRAYGQRKRRIRRFRDEWLPPAVSTAFGYREGESQSDFSIEFYGGLEERGVEALLEQHLPDAGVETAQVGRRDILMPRRVGQAVVASYQPSHSNTLVLHPVHARVNGRAGFALHDGMRPLVEALYAQQERALVVALPIVRYA